MTREAGVLRSVLRGRALTYATARALPYYESLGKKDPVVLFPAIGDRHGNFIDASFQAAQRVPEIRRRFAKRHAQAQALPPQFSDTACELDSSNSSDALLMNIFCYPELENSRIHQILGLDKWTMPVFGIRFCVAGEPKGSPRRHTELDMTFSHDLAIEAKLTESGFQQASRASVHRYHHLDEVFEVQKLPQCRKGFDSYQLIRNVLAAHQRGGRFMVLYDQRRPDLLTRWQVIVQAIRIPELRDRCSTITWQDLAVAVPDELRSFLFEKYGIG
jgi:hypothetical protein